MNESDAFAGVKELKDHLQASKSFNRGIRLFKDQNYSEALLIFEEVLELEPITITALLYQALCKFQLIRQNNWKKRGSDPIEDVQDVISILEKTILEMRSLQEEFKASMDKQLA